VIIPSWPCLCSVGYNDLDAGTETAIKATWGDRGGKLEL